MSRAQDRRMAEQAAFERDRADDWRALARHAPPSRYRSSFNDSVARGLCHMANDHRHRAAFVWRNDTAGCRE